jgi:hypothetical protein
MRALQVSGGALISTVLKVNPATRLFQRTPRPAILRQGLMDVGMRCGSGTAVKGVDADPIDPLHYPWVGDSRCEGLWTYSHD